MALESNKHLHKPQIKLAETSKFVFWGQTSCSFRHLSENRFNPALYKEETNLQTFVMYTNLVLPYLPMHENSFR